MGVAALGALIGALAGWLVQLFFKLNAIDSELLDAQIEAVREIEQLSCDYWSQDAKLHPSETILAQKIEALNNATSVFEPDGQRIFGYKWEDVQGLADTLFELTTGGEFRTKYRTADLERVALIISTSRTLQSKLRQAKRRSLINAR